MSTPFFRFRRFTVWHDRCAMKVGTDGVLLGAWCPLVLRTGARVLDIGTGSGLIALMLAQRYSDSMSDFRVDAVETDAAAAQQASENFASSPWKDHLHVHHTDFRIFHPNAAYHLIVSNPPYFDHDLSCPNPQRHIARHTDTLTWQELISHAAAILHPEGQLCLIIPYNDHETICLHAAQAHLYPTRILHVAGRENKPFKRSLICFGFTTTPHTTPPIPQVLPELPHPTTPPIPQVLPELPHLPTPTEHLHLSTPTEPRSADYAALTRDFYL